MRHDVAVLGSLNLDVVFTCGAMPNPGETILCESVRKGPGGKGLNQAIASGRSGASTILFGAVGADGDGDMLLGVAEASGVSLNGVQRLGTIHTGLAHIVVDRRGENAIVVASGANKAPELDRALFEPADASVFLAQLEMDVDLVKGFFEKGRAAGRSCILNAAPALETAHAVLADCDYLIVNEHELSFFCGKDYAESGQEEIIAAARALARSHQSVLVTLGAQGVIWITSDAARHFPAKPVRAIDTTGAGDCFCGVFAATLAQGRTVPQAIERAMAAAVVTVTRHGAARAIPVAADYDL